jgi:hypothetical protein
MKKSLLEQLLQIVAEEKREVELVWTAVKRF